MGQHTTQHAIQSIAIIALALCFAAAAHAALFSGPSLNATLLYYQPVPASPGSTLDVFVQINNAGETAKNVKIEFNDNAPFTLESESDRVKSIDTIPGQESFLIKYRVQVSQDAIPGTSNLKISYTVDNSNSPQTVLLPIDIFSQTVSLNLENIQFAPDSFVPGSVGTMSFTIRNAAPIKVRDGTVTLDLSGVSITPVGSTNQQRFTDLQSGDTRQFSFDLAPSPDLAPGIYKLPVILNFSDQQGRAYQRSEVIGVRVGAKPDVSVTIDSSKLTSDVKTGDVVIRVTNKGLGQVKFADVTVGSDASYSLLSDSTERYVGNIDSDDYKTALITVQANGKTVTIPYTVTYMDALNTPYTKTGTLTVSVRSAASGGMGFGTIALIVIVLGVVAWFFFRKKKR